jgi:inorganic pyrophosphatase
MTLNPGLVTRNQGVYNYLTEIPKMTKKKMEVMTKLENNPICQVRRSKR